MKSFLGVEAGFEGCVRHLEINDRHYRLEPAGQGGDITAGRDIGESQEGIILTGTAKNYWLPSPVCPVFLHPAAGPCAASACLPSPCLHGRCVEHQLRSACVCPIGFTGPRCGNTVDIQVPTSNRPTSCLFSDWSVK